MPAGAAEGCDSGLNGNYFFLWFQFITRAEAAGNRRSAGSPQACGNAVAQSAASQASSDPSSTPSNNGVDR
jgi:hypothetical protein